MTMKFENIDRKALVKALAEITETKANYKGAPTFTYEISYFTVSRDGSLTCNDMADNEEIVKVLAALAHRGFHCTGTEYDQPQPEIEDEEPQEAPTRPDAIGLTVSIPLDMVAAGNLTNLLEAKGGLIKKALGVDSLPVEITEDTIAFPWFPTMPEPDEVNAYTQLIAALCKMSKAQKRVTAKATDPENEKYAFRCFLLRLGFIGDEYKASRKILLRRLSGNSAWKGGPGHAITELGQIDRLRQQFPHGCRVELLRMEDAGAPPIGTKGTVIAVDDIGSILVPWDNGSSLNVAYSVDLCRKL